LCGALIRIPTASLSQLMHGWGGFTNHTAQSPPKSSTCGVPVDGVAGLGELTVQALPERILSLSISTASGTVNHTSGYRLFHIMLKKLPIMLFSNAPNVAYYAIDSYPLFHIMLYKKSNEIQHTTQNSRFQSSQF